MKIFKTSWTWMVLLLIFGIIIKSCIYDKRTQNQIWHNQFDSSSRLLAAQIDLSKFFLNEARHGDSIAQIKCDSALKEAIKTWEFEDSIYQHIK